MTNERPDPERRLIPRWRSSADSVNAGELRSTQPKKAKEQHTLTTPQFDELKSEWTKEKSLELAADVAASGVALGRTNEKEVQEAAALIIRENSPIDLKRIAGRILEGKIGTVLGNENIPFTPEKARVEIQSQIAAYKRRVRLYPKNPLAWTDLARLYTAVGQQQKALQAIGIATALAPNNRFVLRSAARFFVHLHHEDQKDRLEEGLDLLRGSRLLKEDPWVMAAEISLSTISKVPPKSLKWARTLSDSDSIQPWDSSELNGSLATLAMLQGGVGNPSKLFNKSLRMPTENALAQAQWASVEHGVLQISDQAFAATNVPAFEAMALKHQSKQEWEKVIEACRSWSAMEPTSTRPLILGAYIAEVALEDGESARQFSERALILSPGEPWANNNLAVALAYLGKLEEAELYATKYQPHELPDRAQAVHFATRGLIEYRRGRREEGFHLYLKAAKMAIDQKDPWLRAMIIWHLLREESRLSAPGIDELVDTAWRHTSGLKIPELSAMHERIKNPKGMAVSKIISAVGSAFGGQRETNPLSTPAIEDLNSLLKYEQ